MKKPKRGGRRPGAGRPKSKHPKAHIISFRLTNEEQAALEQAASRAGTEPRELARARTMGRDPKPSDGRA